MSALEEIAIARLGCDRIVVLWEYGIGKLIEKIKIGDYNHHQAVIMEAGWLKLVLGTREGELCIIKHSETEG